MGSISFLRFPCWMDPDPLTAPRRGRAWFVQGQPASNVEVNLARCPAAVRDGLICWKDVDVDDHMSIDASAGTTVGPQFPGGRDIGALALSRPFWTAIPPDKQPTLPPAYTGGNAREYEFQCVLYYDGAADGMGAVGRRYQGFHAEIIDPRTIRIWHAGESASPGRGVDVALPSPGAPAGRDELDWSKCDSVANGYSQVGAGMSAGAGALYIESDYAARTLSLTTPKLPPGWGKLNVRLRQHASGSRDERVLDRRVSWAARGLRWVRTRGKESELRDEDHALTELAADGGQRDPSASLDLIGHSGSADSLLYFEEREGDYYGLDEETAGSLAEYFESPAFRNLGVGRIRLLGCNTADSARGKRAIVALAAAAKVPVYGTRGVVTAADFDIDGFRRDREHLLVSSDDIAAAGLPPAPPAGRGRNFAPTRRALLTGKGPGPDELHRLQGVDTAVPQAVPALLATPTTIVRRGDGSVHSEIYLGPGWVRHFPRDEPAGVGYPITDRDALDRSLKELPLAAR